MSNPQLIKIKDEIITMNGTNKKFEYSVTIFTKDSEIYSEFSVKQIGKSDEHIKKVNVEIENDIYDTVSSGIESRSDSEVGSQIGSRFDSLSELLDKENYIRNTTTEVVNLNTKKCLMCNKYFSTNTNLKRHQDLACPNGRIEWAQTRRHPNQYTKNKV